MIQIVENYFEMVNYKVKGMIFTFLKLFQHDENVKFKDDD